ncbi:uncharacterized protein Z520_11957 [Fonsecaea multimorphosa CBS 102226]|uniref:AB hydrolase-1 domain-containing protein n=1 Tax=Fonsecaea multimorphosa CBS 102226 TaxID=1442371 RepID=A0A0D2JPG1_9EURO|nr:uncharacterized protein Z520_11957 [Fonsecaea multimorphosa CBS 102226]KIX92349.1 hypothetical protein Z520_11957 [Fonsecaea multimorphosa CBS 102226]OAL17722.1 hypothetical protein AYO22_11378 [Fonsecaea multimorphosa]
MPALVLLLALSSATTVHTAPSSPRAAAPKYSISWSNCTEINLPNLQCGTMQVPLGWSQPDGAQISLFMTKIKSTSTTSPGKSLLWNPGGPGVTASTTCQLIGAGQLAYFSPALYEHFDIICPDPRGVGQSTPVKCDPAIYNQMPQLFVDDATSFQKLADWNHAFGNSCLNMTGNLLRHVDTTSAAHDLEAIRLALNQGNMNWFGNSYGSQLGAAYAELYPRNVRALVLDGVVDHSLLETVALSTLATTYEAELNRWFQWCQANTSCALHGQENIPQLFDNLIAQANRAPIPAPGCSNASGTASAGTCQPSVTGYDMIFNAQGAYLSDPRLTGWVTFGVGLNQSLSGNATLLSNAVQTSVSNDAFSGIAIGCLDWIASHSLFPEHQALQQLGSVVAPHTLGANQFFQYSSWCFNWPVAIANPPHSLNTSQVAQLPPESVLLVNAEYDPETSYVWAQGLKDQLTTSGRDGDDKAVVLTRRGDGHTSYAIQGQAARTMDAFWMNRTVPGNGTVVDS